MNDHGFDLNSNMLINNPPPVRPSRFRHLSLLNPSVSLITRLMRQNLTREMRQSINDSINYNAALVLFSLSKIIASIVVLSITEPNCDKPLREWVVFLMMHDGIYAALLLLKIKTILRNGFIREHQEENSQEREDNNESFGRDIFGYRIGDDDSVFAISDEAERKNRLVSALTAVCKTYYYAVFIYAQILYFHTETTCPQAPPTLYNLMVVYVVFGYIYIGMPIVFIVLACLCLPFLLFFSYVFSRGEQVPVPKDILKNLPVIPFTSDLPGTHECSICIGEYKEGDKLIQLRCSPMHHYHDECLKKWLNINGLCPICRSRIEDEENGRKSGVDLEMTATSQNTN